MKKSQKSIWTVLNIDGNDKLKVIIRITHLRPPTILYTMIDDYRHYVNPYKRKNSIFYSENRKLQQKMHLKLADLQTNNFQIVTCDYFQFKNKLIGWFSFKAIIIKKKMYTIRKNLIH